MAMVPWGRDCRKGEGTPSRNNHGRSPGSRRTLPAVRCAGVVPAAEEDFAPDVVRPMTVVLRPLLRRVNLTVRFAPCGRAR
jgi:hypothetical protein